jgi:2-(1,2-epoxy-1,2-dihydrophenyl)acetyl-CoA isomerase
MPPIHFEISNYIGYITLNRPEKLNAFNREMALQLQVALDKCKNPEVRCVYITGAAKDSVQDRTSPK